MNYNLSLVIYLSMKKSSQKVVNRLGQKIKKQEAQV